MKSKIIFLALLSILLLPGCRDQFLDVENKNELDLSSFFKTKSDVILAVNTIYTPQGHVGMHGQNWQMKFGTLDDRIWHENPDGLDRLIIGTDEFKDTYDDCYRGIFRCSDIIKNMKPLVSEGVLTQEESNFYEAQLRALRAYYYFNMVKLWRSPFFYNEANVPINALANYGNSDPRLFWEQIHIDLKFATDPAHGLKNNQWEWGPDDRGRVTRGGALALWGKTCLWKHYYYYLENQTDMHEFYIDSENKSFSVDGYNAVRYTTGGGDVERISRDDNLARAKECFREVMGMGFTLQGGMVSATGTEPAVTKQDFINALLSNSTFLLDLEGFGGKSYRGENNNESLWEVQYNGDNRNAGGWLPAWQWGGAMNFQFTGIHSSSYLNHEMDPDAFYLYEETETGTRAAAAGFDIDPRAYATFYIDETPFNTEGAMLDWRPESGYNRKFTSATDSRSKVTDPTNRLYLGDMPKGTGAVMKRKYSYPIFTRFDGGSMPPNCDPFNVRVLRYADVLLMYAEACLLSGSNQADGLAALNQVRDRAGMFPKTTLDIRTIIEERDMELMAEGFRFLDIVRWSRDQQWFDQINFSTRTASGYGFKENWERYSVSDPNNPAITHRTMYMPIPLSEINKNEGYLKQNPGY